MQFSLLNNETVIVVHHGVQLPFNVKLLNKSKLHEPGKDLFLEINQYLNTLDQHTQYEMFKQYEEIRDLRDNSIGVSFNAQQKESTDIVTEIYRLLDLDKLAAFARTAQISYPDGLQDRNSERAANSNINANINYYRDDYEGLVVLVLALRPMIPIWGEYISINKEAAGTHYKEFRAMKLIGKSSLNYSPYMERLRRYITEWRTTGNNRNMLTDDIAVLDGISSDDLTDYILSLILVRRLSLCNIHATSKENSIISSVYSYLKSKLSEAANTFKTNKKYDDGAGRESGEEMSILEKYKISSKLTHGDRTFLKEYVNHPTQVALALESDVDLFVLDECLRVNHSLNLQVADHQRLLTQWVTNRAFPAQGIYELSKIEVINLMSVAQTLLIQWEMYELAILITGGIQPDSISIAGSSRVNLRDDLLRELDRIYPYHKSNPRQQDKPNVAHDVINKLYNDLSSKTFIINPTPTLMDRANVKEGLYSCPRSLVDNLAELFIKINE